MSFFIILFMIINYVMISFVVSEIYNRIILGIVYFLLLNYSYSLMMVIKRLYKIFENSTRGSFPWLNRMRGRKPRRNSSVRRFCLLVGISLKTKQNKVFGDILFLAAGHPMFLSGHFCFLRRNLWSYMRIIRLISPWR